MSIEIRNDEIIVSNAKKGDGDAFNYILWKYKGYVKSKARTYFLVGGDREDIIQEGMIGLFKAVRDYNGNRDSSFKSFAEMCITRQIITAIKAATRQKHIPLNSYVSLYKSVYDEDTGVKVFDFVPQEKITDPADLIIGSEEVGIIEKEIMSLLSEYELDVFNFYIDGLSYREISIILGKEEKSVDNAIQRIKKKVGRYLEVREYNIDY